MEDISDVQPLQYNENMLTKNYKLCDFQHLHINHIYHITIMTILMRAIKYVCIEQDK